ncbi:unnamed protein product [Lactuca virosa]|uniref:CASP-like protein n=1 Tax=Lactuca virosa TaxID=75947 RepID=A0AAU9NMR8_9ASTR|nr:unnamed protein product [Lactuca virosa]
MRRQAADAGYWLRRRNRRKMLFRIATATTTMASVSSVVVEGTSAAVASSAEDGGGDGIDYPPSISVERRPPTSTFLFNNLGTTLVATLNMAVVKVVGGTRGWRSGETQEWRLLDLRRWRLLLFI